MKFVASIATTIQAMMASHSSKAKWVSKECWLTHYDLIALIDLDALMHHLLWADPRPEPGVGPSARGTSIAFGPDVTAAFLETNKLTTLIRSHEYQDNGYRIDHDGKCITIFSAPNYM